MNHFTAKFELLSIGGISINRMAAPKLSFYDQDDVKIRIHIRDLYERHFSIAGYDVTLKVAQSEFVGNVTASASGLVEFEIARNSIPAGNDLAAVVRLTRSATDEAISAVFPKLLDIKALA